MQNKLQECSPVGCAPPACCPISQHALLPGGVPAQGGTCPGVYLPGDTCPGDVPAREVYLPGAGGVRAQVPLCEQNDRQVQKYYLAPNFICGR